MRKAFSVSLLVLALSCPALAGIIHNPVSTPPPPAEQEEQKTDDTGEPDGFTETVLSVLESVLALF